jgi:hypothetical protein
MTIEGRNKSSGHKISNQTVDFDNVKDMAMDMDL